MPTHFGFSGQPTSFGPKSMYLLLPLLTVVLYGLLSALSPLMRYGTYPVTLTEQNRDRVVALGAEMLSFIKLWLAVTFLTLEIAIVQPPENQTFILSWLAPVSIVAIFGTTILYIARIRRAD